MPSTYSQHAALYDAAFSWDLSEEVEWLLTRLSPRRRTLLEPGCGSARHFPLLLRRGVAPTGVDRLPEMLERARGRMRAEGLPQPTLVLADMADFHLGERFGGAYSPVNTFGCLTSSERAASHLSCVAEHLEAGAAYLVQLDLFDLKEHRIAPPDDRSRWEVEHDGERIRCTVAAQAWDPSRSVETQVIRFEILSGARAGTVLEGSDPMRLWSWSAWRRLIEASPFDEVLAYDASRRGSYPPLEPGPGLDGRRLLWHELRLKQRTMESERPVPSISPPACAWS